MGQNFVSTTIDSPTTLGFKVGDYLTYRGRKFVLAVTPSMQKQARVNAVGNAIKYDNIKFISVASDELTRCEFRDVVNSTKDHYNFAARTFSFHCLTLKDYAERLKANLDRMYGGYTIKILLDNGSTYTIGSTTPYNGNAVGEKNKVIQISNETCWDSLQHVKNDFKVNLYFDGDRTIVLGANGHLISQHHFAYGAGEGLFKISRTTDESQAIITRLRAYGSEKNMPTRFYANLKYLYLLPKEMITEASTSGTRIDLVNGTTDFENDGYLTIGFDGKMLANSNLSSSNEFTSASNGAKKYLIKVRINNIVGWMNIQYNGENYNSYANIGWNNVGEYGNNTETTAKALIAEFAKMQWTYFVIEDGATDTWKYKVTDPSCTIPNNMNVKCLMLAGFGFSGNSLRDEVKAVYDRPTDPANAKLIARLGFSSYAELTKVFSFSDDPSDPYIDAVPQKNAYGVREGTIVFDGSSDDYEEIYPSIEYMGDVDNCPVQKAKVEGSNTFEGNNLRNDGGVVDDLAEAGKEIPQFYLYIKDPSFNPYEYRKSGSNTFKINMLDGMCGGRSFDVKQAKRCTFEDGSVGYRLVCDRVEDNSLDLYFPYSQIQNGLEVGYVIKAGDKYTFSEIEMPSEYVLRTALYELFPAAIEALKKNCDVRFKYELSVDANEMYRQHVLSLADDKVESIHDTIHAGDLILFGDKDLGVNYDENEPNPITGSVIINSIEIKENNERLPQYTIQLVDEKTIGTLERIQRQIESIINGQTTTANSGYSVTDIQGLIRTYGANYFLSKNNRDTAKGDLTFDGVTTFNKDMNVNGEVNFGNSLFKGSSGAGIWKDAQGNWHFQTDFLDVNYSLTAKSIEIQEEKHIGGCQIVTGAGCTIDHVDENLKIVSYRGGQYTAYRCYFLAVDPETGKEINNDWTVGDQARCQSFNLKDGIHFYWRLVLNTSIEPEEIDGKMYHYIDIFAGSASGSLSDDVLNTLRMIGSGTPTEKDDVILLGSQSGIAGRQNAIIIAGAGSGSPYIREYAGIKTFSLNDYCEINIEPNNSFLKVKSLTIITSDGTSKDVEDELNDLAGNIQELIDADGSLDDKIAALLQTLQLSQKEIDDLKDTQQDVQNQLDQTYEFWHVDWEAQFDKDGNLVMPAWNSVEPIVSWIADNVDLSEHIGDFIITANGVCFQFQDKVDGGYELIVRSDKFLIAALGVANNAKMVLEEIANDGIITPQEKTILSSIWEAEKSAANNILSEYEGGYKSKTEYTNMLSHYNALAAAMNTILSNDTWNSNITLSNVVKTPYVSFDDMWGKYYDSKETLLALVSSDIDEKAEEAQAAADAANDTLDDIADDNIITLQEHSELSDIWDNMVSQYNMAIADAGKYSDVAAVNTAKTNLTSAYNTLKAFVEAVLASTGNYTITEAYNTAWSDFFAKLKALRDAITAAAKAVADNAVNIANQALSAIGTMASDGVINTTEKATLKIVWFGIKQIYPSLLASGNIHVGTTSDAYKNYEKAYLALTATMNAVLADMAAPYNLKTDTGADVVFNYVYGGKTSSVTFMDAWDGYYAAEAALQYAIDSAIQADADASIETLENMASDSVITKQEKIQILAELTEITSAHNPLVTEVSNLSAKLDSIIASITSAQLRSPYETAKENLENATEEYNEAYDIIRAMYGYLTDDVTTDTNLTNEGSPLRYKYSTDSFSYSGNSDDGLTYGECVTKYYTEYPQIRSIITITQQIITQFVNNSVDNVDTAISNMANDGLITPQEKTILKIVWQNVQREWGDIEKKNTEAEDAGKYFKCWDELYDYHYALNAIMTAILRNMTTTSNLSTITGTFGSTRIGFTAAWAGYNTNYNNFLEEYEAWKQSLIDEAQETADDAQSASQQAIDTATTTSIQLTEMASDNVITAQEKNAIKERLIELEKERAGIIAEATTANVSSIAYQSAYNGLVCFLEYFVNESGDTYILNSDGTLYATYAYTMPNVARTYSITRAKGGATQMAGIYYTGTNGAVNSYYTALANLRKSITNGVYTAIQQANQSGYDEQVNNYVRGLMSGDLTNLIEQGIENHTGYSQMSAYYSTMSNFSFTKDDDGNCYINGAGIVTSANFATLFAAAYDENGSPLKQALISAFVTQDANGYISNAKIKADRIELEGSITANGNVSIGTDGKITAKEGSFYNGYFNKGTFVDGEFTGKVTATTGFIGGFEIGSNRIGVANTSSSSSYNGMSLYNDFICFNAGSGTKQAIVGTTSFLGTTILGKFTNTENSYGHNYGLVVNVQNGINNHAMSGSGNVSMDGFVDGYKMQKVNLSSSNTFYIVSIETGNRFYVTGTASGSGITLPTLQSMCDTLALSTTGTGTSRRPTTNFMVKLTFVSGNTSNSWRIVGRNRIVTQKSGSTTTYPQDSSIYPQLLNNDFGNIESITLQKGDCHEIMLVYDYSANQYYAFRLNYRD